MNTLARDLRRAGALHANDPEALALAIAVALARNGEAVSISIGEHVVLVGLDEGIADVLELAHPDGTPVEGPVLMLAVGNCDEDAEPEDDFEVVDLGSLMFPVPRAALQMVECDELGTRGRYDGDLLPRSWRLGNATTFTLAIPREWT